MSRQVSDLEPGIEHHRSVFPRNGSSQTRDCRVTSMRELAGSAGSARERAAAAGGGPGCVPLDSQQAEWAARRLTDRRAAAAPAARRPAPDFHGQGGRPGDPAWLAGPGLPWPGQRTGATVNAAGLGFFPRPRQVLSR